MTITCIVRELKLKLANMKCLAKARQSMTWIRGDWLDVTVRDGYRYYSVSDVILSGASQLLSQTSLSFFPLWRQANYLTWLVQQVWSTHKFRLYFHTFKEVFKSTRKSVNATNHFYVPQIYLVQWSLHEAYSLCVYMCRVLVYASKWGHRRKCYSYPLNPPEHTHDYVHTHTPPIQTRVPASHLVRTWSSYEICPPGLALIHQTNTPITLIMPRVQQKTEQHTHTHHNGTHLCRGGAVAR